MRVAFFSRQRGMVRNGCGRSLMVHPENAVQAKVKRVGQNHPEMVKWAGSYREQICCRAEVNTSPGAISEVLYYNKVEKLERSPDTLVEAYADMKWFRSNIRLGSRLALFALAIQFLLSFGHFHSGNVPATDANRSGLHDAVYFTVAHLDTLDGVSHAVASGPVRLKTTSGHVPAGQPSDDCAICVVMALANATVDAAPPYLLAPQAASFSYLTAGSGFVDLNSARVAFQPRAPPIA